ncbi:hypothetical protein DRP77_10895, partial [Candidatus Poribacteria bacterium]
FRAYVPGDDPRFIDWKAYARLDRVYLRLFLEERSLNVYLMLDVSGSMGFGKLDLGRAVALSLAHIALLSYDSVVLIPFSERPGHPARTSGRRGIFKLMSIAGMFEPSGRTDLRRSLAGFLNMRWEPGLLILISDLLDPAVPEALKIPLLGGFELDVIQVLSAEEIDPKPSGALTLVDAETDERREVVLDEASIERYKRRMERFLRGIEEFCASKGVRYALIRTDEPVERAVFGRLRRAGIVI